MRIKRLIGATFVAVLAMSAVAVASASAHLFDSTKAGEAIKSEALATQVFTTAAGKVECTKLKTEKGTTVQDSKTQEITIKYEGCKAFGLTAKVSPANFKFHTSAGEGSEDTGGTVDVLKEVTITALGCTVKVPAQNGLGTVTYKTVEEGGVKHVELIPNVSGITSSGEGTACTYEKESKGTYKGASKAFATNSVFVEGDVS